MSELKNQFHLLIHVEQIEKCINITHVTWKLKPHPEQLFNMHKNVKQDLIDTVKQTRLCLSRKK